MEHLTIFGKPYILDTTFLKTEKPHDEIGVVDSHGSCTTFKLFINNSHTSIEPESKINKKDKTGNV